MIADSSERHPLNPASTVLQVIRAHRDAAARAGDGTYRFWVDDALIQLGRHWKVWRVPEDFPAHIHDPEVSASRSSLFEELLEVLTALPTDVVGNRIPAVHAALIDATTVITRLKNAVDGDLVPA